MSSSELAENQIFKQTVFIIYLFWWINILVFNHKKDVVSSSFRSAVFTFSSGCYSTSLLRLVFIYLQVWITFHSLVNGIAFDVAVTEKKCIIYSSPVFLKGRFIRFGAEVVDLKLFRIVNNCRRFRFGKIHYVGCKKWSFSLLIAKICLVIW